MMDLDKLIQSAASAAWRAGCDEQDGPARIEGIVRRFAEQVRAERDMEWWGALAGVDAIAPTPEAVKAWVLTARSHMIDEACRAVCRGCERAIELRDGWHWLGVTVESDCSANPIRRAFAAAQDDPEVSR